MIFDYVKLAFMKELMDLVDTFRGVRVRVERILEGDSRNISGLCSSERVYM